MMRQRKKDLNFKPNRVLDKKSGRGMLYENEELRLRTIHINDEVDRGQHDIKKLKKENEHLKREIWSLRDKYDKVSTMLRRVMSQEETCLSDYDENFDLKLEELIEENSMSEDEEYYSNASVNLEENLENPEIKVTNFDFIDEEPTIVPSNVTYTLDPTIEYKTEQSGQPGQVIQVQPFLKTFKSLPPTSEKLQDLGCITVLPKTFTSEVRIPQMVSSPSPVRRRLRLNEIKMNKHRHSLGGEKKMKKDDDETKSCDVSVSEPSLNLIPNNSRLNEVEAQELNYLRLLKLRLHETPSMDVGVSTSLVNLVNNVIVGTPETQISPELKTQHVIDEIEKLNPRLDFLSGVRLLQGKLFISLKSESGVKDLIEKTGGKLILLNKYLYKLTEGSLASSTIVLSGVSAEVPDLAVLAVLNNLGQVVSPLERKYYKGIDISERLTKIHFVHLNIPASISINGVTVGLRVESAQVGISLPNANTNGGMKTPVNKRNSSPSPSIMTNGSGLHRKDTIQHKLMNVMKDHKPVGRTISSAPRLEMTQRQSSFYGGEVHHKKPLGRSKTECVRTFSNNNEEIVSRVMSESGKDSLPWCACWGNGCL